MAESKFDTGAKSGKDIKNMSAAELCEFAVRLCKAISAEVGSNVCRGGVYPENINLDEKGKVNLGPAKSEEWEEEELKFIAPELYWHSSATQAADVYSVGMLLYYGVSGGKLPFDGSENAQLRRMGGESFAAPDEAGRRLSEIISKATAFNASERYQNLEELSLVLENCEKNLYIDEEKGAEAIFNKPEEELSDIERMMVGIIEGDKAKKVPVSEVEETAENSMLPVHDGAEESLESAAEEAAEAGEAENETVEEAENEEAAVIAEESTGEETPAEKEETEAEPVPILTVEENPEFEPVFSRTPIIPAVQYSKSLERERKIAEEVKKRRRRPMMFILICCALLIVVAIVANAVMNDAREQELAASQTPAVQNSTAPLQTSPALTEPIGGQEPETAPESTPEPTPDVPKESRYQIVREDLSWTEARQRCTELGGHLAVIEDMAEYDKIVSLASEQDAAKLWIGCSRVNGQLVWVNGKEASYYPWAEGEPSLTDSLDGAAEDYIMLCSNNDGWYLNDTRNDPIDQYPQWYSGTIGFICEFEG